MPQVVDIGMATTPMLYAAIIDGDFHGGAMITASHLPAHYNGVKLCREKAIPPERGRRVAGGGNPVSREKHAAGGSGRERGLP